MPLGLPIHKCFPDPLSGNWPATHHPVLCECRQLYALVSICCCLPAAHLLVLHDGPVNSSVTSMPKGPKYLELSLTESTCRDTICGSFIGADSLSTPGDSSGNVLRNMNLKVAILHNIAAASPQVMSAVMDVLSFGLVRHGGVVRRVPMLRIVAFCDAAVYASALPENVRQAFALSTYMSAMSTESPAVIQSTDWYKSNVVNRRHMTEVMLSADGADLIESVTLAASVSRYLRHLLSVLRGSMLMHSTVGVFAPSRLPLLLRILRVGALLFAAPGKHSCGRPFARTTVASSCISDASSAITGFAHVIVSPSDVMCLLCPMLAHLFTVRREMAQMARGPGAMQCIGSDTWRGDFSRALSAAQEGPAAADAFGEARWDAHVLRWAAPLPRGRAATTTATTAAGALLGPLGPLGGAGGALENSSRVECAASSREPSLTVFSMDDRAAAVVLSYPECRELIRLTILHHSAPAPG